MSLWEWLFRRREREEDLDEEIQAHLKMAAQERLEQGETARQARTSALREFGNVALVKDTTRDIWGFRWLEELLQDLRYGVRQLKRNPGFTAVAVLTLAMGIGANATIFSIVNQIVFRPLAYARPDRLLMVWEHPAKGRLSNVSTQTYLDWRDQNTVFEQLAAVSETTFTLAGNPPTFVPGAHVSHNFFNAFRLHPAVGRFLISAESLPDAQHIVVISKELWQSKLGSKAGIIGSSIRLNGESYTVVGIMPAGFEFQGHIDVWTPLALNSGPVNRSHRNLTVVGRLKPGITTAQAQQEMNVIAARIARESPETNKEWGVQVQAIKDALLGPGVRIQVLILLAIVGAVLLMACANMANLQLARSAVHGKEIAVRMALGAQRSRLVRQLLTESFLVAVSGGALGLTLAYWAVSYLATLAVLQAPGASRLSMDGVVFSFVAVLCIVCTLASGLAPAWQVTRARLLDHIKTASRSSLGDAATTRFNNALVIGEFALSFVLLVIAVGGTRSFLKITNSDAGLPTRRLLTAYISLPAHRYASAGRVRNFYSALLDKVAAIPGVEGAAISTGIPPRSQVMFQAIGVEGRQRQPSSGEDRVSYQVVSPGYFRLFGLSLVQGREFTSADHQGAIPVVTVNHRLAELYFPNESPIGKRLLIPVAVPGQQDLAVPYPYEIVGIVEDSRNPLPMRPVSPEIYLSYLQAPWTDEHLALRGNGDTAALSAALRGVVQNLDPDQPLTEVLTISELYRNALGGARLNATLIVIFAALALFLGCMGLYGIVSFSANQREPEFALRMALGAKRRDIFGMVSDRALGLMLTGAAIGLPFAVCSSLLMRVSLYGISPFSAYTFLCVALVQGLATVAASILPAWRAAKVDPIVALRDE